MNKHPLLFSLTGKRGYKKVKINCPRFWLSVPTSDMRKPTMDLILCDHHSVVLAMRKQKFKGYHLQNLMLWIARGW